MIATLSTTQILAVFIGLYMVAAGIGLLVDRGSYTTLIGDCPTSQLLGT